mgnify:CR=1 FL=1|jgi:hypothetical protein
MRTFIDVFVFLFESGLLSGSTLLQYEVPKIQLYLLIANLLCEGLQPPMIFNSFLNEKLKTHRFNEKLTSFVFCFFGKNLILASSNKIIMKKTLLTFSFLFATLFVFAQTTTDETFDENAPAFQFEEEVIDYGKIEQNADGNRVFKFTNSGKSPLIISNAKGSCGCTVPTYDKNTPIMPGETGEIKVKYATNRVGRFSKTITLTSNASETKKILRIKGEVLKPAE